MFSPFFLFCLFFNLHCHGSLLLPAARSTRSHVLGEVVGYGRRYVTRAYQSRSLYNGKYGLPSSPTSFSRRREIRRHVNILMSSDSSASQGGKVKVVIKKVKATKKSAAAPVSTDIKTAIDRLIETESGERNKDVRDTHPFLTSAAAASDLDLCFLGTASCIPATTRGTSCLALRVNWRRSSHEVFDDSPAALKKPPAAMMITSSDGPSKLYEDDKKSSTDNDKSDKTNTVRSGTWLFDCGEGTQLQLQRCGVRAGKITKIFLTHCHGDHTFGLLGTLCFLGQDCDRDGPPVEIYGPEGLRNWLRASLRFTQARVVPPYRVHELKDVPLAPGWKYLPAQARNFFTWSNNKKSESSNGKSIWEQDDNDNSRNKEFNTEASWLRASEQMPLEIDSRYGEIEGGRDIYPSSSNASAAPHWIAEDEGDIRVIATPMSHNVPCVGFVCTEADRAGKLDVAKVMPVLKRNFDTLLALGYEDPMKLLAVVKDLRTGSSFSFPDGTILHQQDIVSEKKKGRKVVICGDTSDSSSLLEFGKDCDVLIHEATNAFLPSFDAKVNTYMDLTRDTIKHGHSTPQMTGKFAKQLGAKRLIMNHFSPRYRGDSDPKSLRVMKLIEDQAIEASGLDAMNVIAAWDFMVTPIN
jgi:ribonuclease Z